MTPGQMATAAHPAESGAPWPGTANEQDSKALGAPEPPARDLVDGYISMLKNAYDDRPKYKAVDRSRRGSSALIKVRDPVAMHLLVETAIGDSQEFEVLSLEELEDIKKEYLLLSNRAEATRRRLLLESKVRDAAHSLSRLNSDRSLNGADKLARSRQRSVIFSKETVEELNKKTEDQYAISNRKCEDLAQELWRVERRLSEVQRQMLQHTAGILQVTHRESPELDGYPPDFSPQEGSARMRRLSRPQQNGGRRASTERNGGSGGRGSLYTAFRKDSESGQGGAGPPPQVSELNQSIQAIRVIEQTLESLNRQLRDAILQTDVRSRKSFGEPPQHQEGDSLDMLAANVQAQLHYLAKGLNTMARQQHETAGRMRNNERVLKEGVGALSDELHQLMLESQIPHDDLLSEMGAMDLEPKTRFARLHGGFQLLKAHMRTSAPRKAQQQEAKEQYETVLGGLWDILMSAETHGGDDKARRQSVAYEPYSLQAFSAKVQWLYARAEKLEQEKDILRRQIHQQRELSQQSDSTKDTIVTQLTEEVDRLKRELQISRQDTANLQDELATAMEKLDAARKELAARDEQRANDEHAAMNGLSQRQQEILRLEAEIQDLQDHAERTRSELQDRLGEGESKMQSLQQELQGATRENERLIRSQAELTRQIDEKSQRLEAGRTEMEQMEGEVVRLQTEATVARAELDGAQGPRSQRAAAVGVALDPALQREMDELARRNLSLLEEIAALKTVKQSESTSGGDLQQRVDKLQKELSETIDEYEAMTKQSVEFERDREQLESTIDSLRERCEATESQLNDEKLKWLGMNGSTPGGVNGGGVSDENGAPVENTSMMVLRNEFRKMMREMKAEGSKALRAEQEERRRLEGVVRAMKKEKEQASQKKSAA